VRDHSIVSTGFNGPSRGIPHCGHDRIIKDNELIRCINFVEESCIGRNNTLRYKTECPRKILGYESGTHMELCPAQHAENNAIIDAARKGASTIGTTLYMNAPIPCKNCFGALINAGIVEIVVDVTENYDKHTQYLIDNSNIKIRRFSL
jgi:dCMP deaminase